MKKIVSLLLVLLLSLSLFSGCTQNSENSANPTSSVQQSGEPSSSVAPTEPTNTAPSTTNKPTPLSTEPEYSEDGLLTSIEVNQVMSYG